MTDPANTPWRQIPIDEILDYMGSFYGWAERYDRIMRQYSIEATKELTDTVYKSGQQQGRQQKAIIWLTIIIVLATVAYTYITWESVTAMREGNEIQRQLLEFQKSNSGLQK